MMPVIRITVSTWGRLKWHARPLEDSVNDVLNFALDALDRSKGVSPKPKEKRIAPKSISRGPKLPQKEFRLPLMEVLLELGGSAQVSDIMEKLEPRVKPRLSKADYDLVSNGQQRWWNAICWERNDLVKEGLFRNDSPRGTWELSNEGRRHLSSLKKENYNVPN